MLGSVYPDCCSVLLHPCRMGSCSQLPFPNPAFLFRDRDWVEAGRNGSSPLCPGSSGSNEAHFCSVPFKVVDTGLSMESVQPALLCCPLFLTIETFLHGGSYLFPTLMRPNAQFTLHRQWLNYYYYYFHLFLSRALFPRLVAISK